MNFQNTPNPNGGSMSPISKRSYLNTEQAAEFINRTPGAVRNLVMRQRIPFRKRAGRVYFFSDELERWMDSAPGIRLEDLKS